MGKANRKLAHNINAHYNDINKKYTEIIIEDIGQNTKSSDTLYNEKVYNTSLEIQKELIKYSHEGGYTLCEYLDFSNIENYVKWLLRDNE
jgi:uncharacterized membrane protein